MGITRLAKASSCVPEMICSRRIFCDGGNVDTELLAKHRVEAILDNAAVQDNHPDVIRLASYEDEGTFNFLLPDAGWTLEAWQAVTRRVAHRLRSKHKLKVSMIPVKLIEYFNFLARYGLENTPENRVQFIAWLTAPEPKLEPVRNKAAATGNKS